MAWILGGIFVIALIAFLIFSFPLRPDIRLSGRTQTLDGNLGTLELDVSANQLIRGIRYSLNPTNPNNIDAYDVLDDISGSWFHKHGELRNVVLDDPINDSARNPGPFNRARLDPRVGNHMLYVVADTLFGFSEPRAFNLQFASAFASPPDPDRIRDTGDGRRLVTNELLVSLTPGTPRSVAEQLAYRHNAEIVGEIPVIDKYQLRFNLPESEVENIRNMIESEPNVALVHPNYVHNYEELTVFPNDSGFDSWSLENPDGNNWNYEVIEAPRAWARNRDLKPVAVGVADGSIEYSHPDLQVDPSRIYFFPTHTVQTIADIEVFYAKADRSPGSNYYGNLAHGTHVSGTVGAIGNNGEGISGVHWSPELHFFHYWHMDISPNTGELLFSNRSTIFELEVTITTMVEQGCRVLNYSVGERRPSDPGSRDEIQQTIAFGDLCLRLEQAGYDFLICKAAGNEEGADSHAFEMNRIMTGTDPARRHTLIVASIENTPISLSNWNDPRIRRGYALSNFTNIGAGIDVAAPGTKIFSTYPNATYGDNSGTSMASPMVAGTAALVYAANPSLTAAEVRSILMNETTVFTSDGTNLIPVINAGDAVTYAFTGQRPELPPEEVIDGPGDYPGPPEVVDPAPRPTPPQPSPTPQPTPRPTQPPPTTTQPPAANGRVDGRVVDASDGCMMMDTPVEVRRGLNNPTGELVTELRSGNTQQDAGLFSVDLPAGDYTLVGRSPAYQDGVASVTVRASETVTLDVPMVPQLATGQARIVLTWGDAPDDLDIHLTGTLPDGSACHVWPFDPSSGPEGAPEVTIDLDDKDGNGPETLTLRNWNSGSYTLFVHDFSNLALMADSYGLARSGARVTIYLADGTSQEFAVPNQEGTLWTVCRINNGVITPVNTMDYEGRPLGIADR
ncbi:MAG: S8 family serine peptidase [Bacillota bacterium]|nr:S8 family serine peptidase [Bacillota bacterium]